MFLLKDYISVGKITLSKLNFLSLEKTKKRIVLGEVFAYGRLKVQCLYLAGTMHD